MTEAQWLACGDPRAMIGHLQDTAGGRKMFLFAASCWRRWPHVLRDEASRNAIAALEAVADGREVDESGLLRAGGGRLGIYFKRTSGPIGLLLSTSLEHGTVAARVSVEMFAKVEAAEADGTNHEQYLRAFIPLLRDIFGNPFSPVVLSPDWLTPTAVALARGMYGSRDFSPMPILADALQDAGCDSEEVLGHCRGDGPHVRGCWVVDLVLGKT